MTDRNELRRLAEACKRANDKMPHRRTMYDEKAWQDWDDAASPDVVLGLLDEIEREKSGWFQRYVDAECARKDAEIERDHLRAVLGAIATHNPAVTHGWAEQVREMARSALKAR